MQVVHQGATHHPLAVDFLLSRLGKIIGHLQPQPCFRGGTERLDKRMAISGEMPALPLTKLFNAWRVTPSTFAPAVTVSPSGSFTSGGWAKERLPLPRRYQHTQDRHATSLYGCAGLPDCRCLRP